MRKNILFIFALIFAFSACKKDPVSSPKVCQKTVADISGNYALIKIELLSGASYSDITTTYLQPCQLDDKLMLNANGVAGFVDEGIVCTPNGSRNGTWSIPAEGKITIAGGTISVTSADIVSFDCNTMVLFANQTFAGFPVQIRLTIKK
jgi:hypothetical protein